MYCRRCGKKLPEKATTCEFCGTDVIEVKQRPYAEKYKESRDAERAEKAAEREEAKAEAERVKAEGYPADAGIQPDPYYLPGFVLALLAALATVFPWPAEWGIGTSLPMKIGIIVAGGIALVLGLLAKRIEDANVLTARAYSKKHKKRAFGYAAPGMAKVISPLAALAVLMSVASLFMT